MRILSLMRPSLLFVCLVCFVVNLQAAETAKKTFDLPAGDAEKTLQVFIEQSGEQVMFPPAKVTGVQTNAVRGEMTTGAALDAMLRETKLTAVRNAKTGALTIIPSTDPKKIKPKP